MWSWSYSIIFALSVSARPGMPEIQNILVQLKYVQKKSHKDDILHELILKILVFLTVILIKRQMLVKFFLVNCTRPSD